MPLAEDIDDDVAWGKVLEADRHKQLLSAIKQLIAAVSKPDVPKDDGIAKAIEKNSAAIGIFVEKIKALAAPVAPDVNVVVNQDSVIGAIGGMAASINQNLSDLKDAVVAAKKQSEYEFIIKRGINGTISSVTAKSKL